MHGAPIGREVVCLPVRVPEEPQQIVGELARHLVHVDPERPRGGRGLPVEPGLLLGPDRGFKVAWSGRGGGGVRGCRKEALEGGEEGGGGGGARARQDGGGGAGRGGGEEEEVGGGEEDESARGGEEPARGGGARVRQGGELLPRHGGGSLSRPRRSL